MSPSEDHSVHPSAKAGQLHFIESFNGRFRDECLNEHWFTSLEDARRTIERTENGEQVSGA